MNIFFTSDHHFGHKNIIEYSKRPFSSIEEMDEELISRWNERVGGDDTVYHLGDFCLAARTRYFPRLNGRILFIKGSHDGWMNERAYPYIRVVELPQEYWTSKNSLPVVLCHYAMRSWDRSHYGSWHLFGHHHGSLPPYGLSFDVGVDSHNFYPWSIEEIAEKMKTLSPIVDYSKKRD